MDAAFVSLAAGFGTFAFFAGIALLQWIDSKNKRFQQQLTHAERMKSLELGQPLPDAEVARARAEYARCVTIGLVGLLVPPAALGTAVGATALVLHVAAPNIHLPLLCVVWGVAGVVGLVAVTASLPLLSRKSAHGDDAAEADPDARLHERIKQSPLNV